MSYECHHPFSIFLAGAEAPIWRSLLTEAKAPHIAVNFLNLAPRLPKKAPYLLAERYDDAFEILIDSGGFGAELRGGIDHDAHAARYTNFVAENIDRASLVTEYDPSGMSLDWIEQWREDFWDAIPREKFVPMWHEEHGLDELEHLCNDYARVGILKPKAGNVEAKIRALGAQTGVKFHGAAITGPDDLRRLPVVTASSTSWISPTRFGDSQIWAGGRLHWYPAKSLKQSRGRHRVDVERAGFDADLYIAGDRKEVARYTIWAWRQYEADLAAKRGRKFTVVSDISERLDTSTEVGTARNSNEEGGAVSTGPARVYKAELVLRPDKMVFPGLLMTAEKVVSPQVGEPDTVAVVSLRESGLRRCDSCYLSSRCPAYEPGSECAFNMPVEIRTKEQLLRSLTSCLEMQLTRVVFARAAEEADGGIINADVSLEIERYMKMVGQLKEIQSDTTFLRIEAKGSGAPGILSQLLGNAFGAKQGAALGTQARAQNDLDPVVAEDVLHDFIDAIPVDDEES